MIEQARLIVAFRACDMVMAGGLPRFYIDGHLVTKAAESGGLCEFKKGTEENEKCDDAKKKEDFYSSEMCLGTSLRLVKKIDPKCFDILVKILKLTPAKKIFQPFDAQLFEPGKPLEILHRIPHPIKFFTTI